LPFKDKLSTLYPVLLSFITSRAQKVTNTLISGRDEVNSHIFFVLFKHLTITSLQSEVY